MKNHISTQRLKSYINILEVSEENCIRAYYWNLSLTKEIMPVLSLIEVLLRNSIHNAVINYHEVNMPFQIGNRKSYIGNKDWLKLITTEIQDTKIRKMSPKNKKKWFDVDKKERKQFSYLENEIQKEEEKLQKNKSSYDENDLISNLKFGFWTSLLGKDFEDQTNNSLLWPNVLHETFKYAPASYIREKAKEDLDRIRNLRNRYAHNEPLWKFYKKIDDKYDYKQPIIGVEICLELLQDEYDHILKIIKYLSLETYDYFIENKYDENFRALCSKQGLYNFINS